MGTIDRVKTSIWQSDLLSADPEKCGSAWGRLVANWGMTSAAAGGAQAVGKFMKATSLSGGLKLTMTR